MTENTIESTQDLEVFDTIQTILNQTLSKDFVKQHRKKTLSGISSGFNDLDEITQGFQAGEVTTIVVRPGIGKTAFLLSLVSNIAISSNTAAGIFSGRRPSSQIVSRLISTGTGLSINKINSGDLTDFEENKVNITLNNLYKSNLFIDDSKGPSLIDLMDRARKLVAAGIEIIFIDFLETIINSTEVEDCNEEKCHIMKQLNTLAKELNIPIVVFSALKQPVLYKNKFKYTPDSVNDNTDTLIFLNRPDYYHINAIDKKEKGIAEVTIAKNANIDEPIMISLRIIESLDKFVNL
ncbi:MAG: DnaB-like helicase C-terminal domain-containing protein [Bacteroidales bacterium]|nr:DnaB-like helicase C-terminal domain-containing protein [Bacteroidales bacterium]